MTTSRAQRRFERFLELVQGGSIPYDFTKKENAILDNIIMMLNKTCTMFIYEGLPENMPAFKLEQYLQMRGHCAATMVNGELYFLTGLPGGKQTPYYEPDSYIVANPWLNFNRELKIDKDCVLCKNLPTMSSLYPLFSKYATLLTEGELSLSIAEKLTRATSIMSATSDGAYESASKYMENIENGELKVILDNETLPGLDGIKIQQAGDAASKMIVPLIEAIQYVKGSWLNEVGINANYNMKRESLNSEESILNQDALYPLIDVMYHCRKDFVDKINTMYGTNITVDYHSAWKMIRDVEEEQDNMDINEGEEKEEGDNNED